ncbi:hypothetical protein SI65_08191 [Aspergillus cristatus]|uniref:DUF1917 domain-containing protein n=1 Tax=Aspergillus cristatus TaxID=573508 RepID=A0A1E3B5G6_ASPCR|nr:hypothetical protein SI65_08191 [Aspergillus cristatus]
MRSHRQLSRQIAGIRSIRTGRKSDGFKWSDVKALHNILAKSFDDDPYRATYDPDLVPILARFALPEGTHAQKQAEIVSAFSRDLPLNGRGQDEPVPKFLARLPPSTTKDNFVSPWIYVCRPGWQDNINEESLATFIMKGTGLLEGFEDTKATLEAHYDRSGGKKETGLAGKLGPIRRALQKDIFASAREMNVLTGKWMLFVSVGRVDAVWKAVVEATVSGELGHAAKVSANPGECNREDQAIMIYTRDYEDTDDIRRVLEKLIELGLVKDDKRPIYYKADAYTYLRIFADNLYGLRASLFSSKDFLSGKA